MAIFLLHLKKIRNQSVFMLRKLKKNFDQLSFRPIAFRSIVTVPFYFLCTYPIICIRTQIFASPNRPKVAAGPSHAIDTHTDRHWLHR